MMSWLHNIELRGEIRVLFASANDCGCGCHGSWAGSFSLSRSLSCDSKVQVSRMYLRLAPAADICMHVAGNRLQRRGNEAETVDIQYRVYECKWWRWQGAFLSACAFKTSLARHNPSHGYSSLNIDKCNIQICNDGARIRPMSCDIKKKKKKNVINHWTVCDLPHRYISAALLSARLKHVASNSDRQRAPVLYARHGGFLPSGIFAHIPVRYEITYRSRVTFNQLL